MSNNLSNTLKLPTDTFSSIVQIGNGAFAEVYRAFHLATKSDVALKVFKKNNCDLEMVKKEISIHEALHHPLIVEAFGHFETKDSICMVMEYINGLTLLEKINYENGMNEEEAQYIFVELIYAIKYLHQHNITHRDLKLENIILDECGNIRIIDFGFSYQLKKENKENEIYFETENNENYLMKTHCGSIPYCAPELFLDTGYTSEVDIWSLGVILYSMISGNLPFYDTNLSIFMNKIKFSEPLYDDSKFSDLAMDLIQKMLIKDPNHRITIKEIIEHPFVTGSRIYSTLFCGLENKFDSISAENLSTNDRIRKRMNFPIFLNDIIEKSALNDQKKKYRTHSQYALKPITQIPIGQQTITDTLKRMPTVTLYKKPKTIPVKTICNKQISRTCKPPGRKSLFSTRIRNGTPTRASTF